MNPSFTPALQAAVPPALLLLCLYDTPENQRWRCSARTLTSLGITAGLRQQALWVVDNGSTCPHSAAFLREWCEDQWRQGALLRVFSLPGRRPATYAFNRLLALAPPEPVVVRVENDIEFHTVGWPGLLVNFLTRSGFGLVSPLPLDLPTQAASMPTQGVGGFRAHVVDEVPGFCTAFSPALRARLGALVSAGRYIEDVLTAERARAAGFGMAFLAAEELRCFHVDRAASASYTAWKQQAVADGWATMVQARQAWREGRRPVYEAWQAEDGDGWAEWPGPLRES